VEREAGVTTDALIALGETLARERDAAFYLWTWLPSRAAAERAHGDYASEHRPGNADIMREAAPWPSAGQVPLDPKDYDAPAVNADMYVLGDALRLVRERSGRTMGDLARFLGVPVTTISDLERGRVETARRILAERPRLPPDLRPATRAEIAARTKYMRRKP
jgi:hypothetical protein